MTKHTYSKDLTKCLRSEEATPVCGVDFCDHCGDCLHCYGDDECQVGPGHLWVQYEDTPATTT